MKTFLTFALLMMSSTMLYSAPAFGVYDFSVKSEQSVSNSNTTGIPALKETHTKTNNETVKSENDQCSLNSRIELRGRLILEKKYNLYT